MALDAIHEAVLKEGLTDYEWAALKDGCDRVAIKIDNDSIDDPRFIAAKGWFMIGLEVRNAK